MKVEERSFITAKALFRPVPLNPLIDPLPHVPENDVSALVGLSLNQGMVHPLVELQGLVLARSLLIQQLGRHGACDAVGSPVHREERRRDLREVVLDVLANPGELSHGPHSWLPGVPPWVRRNDLQLLRVLDGFSHHLVVGHACPRVGKAEQQPVHEQTHLRILWDPQFRTNISSNMIAEH